MESVDVEVTADISRIFGVFLSVLLVLYSSSQKEIVVTLNINIVYKFLEKAPKCSQFFSFVKPHS